MTRATIDALLDGTLRSVPEAREDLFSATDSFHSALLHLFFEEWIRVGGKVMDGSFQRVRDAVVAKASASAASVSRRAVYERSLMVNATFEDEIVGEGEAAGSGEGAEDVGATGGFSEI